MKTVENLIYQISDVEKEIEDLETKVDNLQEKIDQSEKDIQQKTEEYNKQEALLDARLLALYKSGDTSFLEIFLTSSSMTEFLANYYLAQELVSKFNELTQKDIQEDNE